MILAIQGNFAYSFILGVLAAVNPCGFVLLPTYLLFFLGSREQPNLTTRDRIARALVVSSGVSVGFLGVFFIVGVISRLFTQWIEINAKYFAFGIGIALVIFGLRMFTGWTPKFAIPNLGKKQNKTFLGMATYGVAYAVASIGCTIGFLTTAVFGSINVHGFVAGILSIVLYGLGMSLFVTALTVSLAFAKTGIVTVIKNRLGIVERLGACLMMITGLYLIWYWYAAIRLHSPIGFVRKIEKWQSLVATELQHQGAMRLAISMSVVVVVALVVVRRKGSKPNN